MNNEEPYRLHIQEETPLSLIENNEDIVKIMKALSNTTRIEIISALLKGNRLFANLKKITHLSKTALAHHLDLLQQAGIVNQISRGSYEITKDGIAFARIIAKTYMDSDIYQKIVLENKGKYMDSVYERRMELMKNFDCKIVTLDPMRVASVRVISDSPENDAWEKMKAWAKPLGLLDDIKKHPVFGFNNPSPKEGSKEYGYEFWIKIDPDMQIKSDVEVKEFQGGLFATAKSKLSEDIDFDGILKTWKKLSSWIAINEEYEIDHSNPCLEKSTNPDSTFYDLILELHLAIKPKPRG